MRTEERVTVQGPVKEQQPDGMSHRGEHVSQQMISMPFYRHGCLDLDALLCPALTACGFSVLFASVEYQAWKEWHVNSYNIAPGFMSAKDFGAMAAVFHTKLLRDGLSMAGVDRVVNWADPDSSDPADTLLAITPFEKQGNYKLDIEQGCWVHDVHEGPREPAMNSEVQREIDALPSCAGCKGTGTGQTDRASIGRL